MSVMLTTRSNRLPNNDNEDAVDHVLGASVVPAPDGKLVQLPVMVAAPEQRILAVNFHSPDGRRWHAIGGGDTIAEAIHFARESCPDNTTWNAIGWNDLYGD